MVQRVLAIDVGIWNFSYAVVYRSKANTTVERWQNVSLPELAGYPIANGRISANVISMTLLTDICFAALGRLFPADYVLHQLDGIWIESQPRFNGKASKIAELSYSIYSYFRATIDPSRLCCWRFPNLHMVGAGTKFDGGSFFGLSAALLVPTPEKKTSYAQRKAYGVELVTILMKNPATLHVAADLRNIYRSARKKDDYSDALLLAAVALRE